jgi:hypothetical protein
MRFTRLRQQELAANLRRRQLVERLHAVNDPAVLHAFIERVAIRTGRGDIIDRELQTFARFGEPECGPQRVKPQLRIVER